MCDGFSRGKTRGGSDEIPKSQFFLFTKRDGYCVSLGRCITGIIDDCSYYDNISNNNYKIAFSLYVLDALSDGYNF